MKYTLGYDINRNDSNAVQTLALRKLFTSCIMISTVLYVSSPIHAPIFQSAYYLGNVFGQEQFQRPESNSCITYDPQEKIITITCRSATLTDIDDQQKTLIYYTKKLTIYLGP